MADENDGPPFSVILDLMRGKAPSLEDRQMSLEVELRSNYFNFFRQATDGLFANSDLYPSRGCPPQEFADEVKKYANALFLAAFEGMDEMESNIKQRAMKRVVEVEGKIGEEE